MATSEHQLIRDRRQVAAIHWIFVLVLGIGTFAHAGEPNWPQFRGSGASGVNDAKPLIAEFGPEQNLLWKTELPGGHSSPCIWGNRIFLTGYNEEVKQLETLAIDRHDGSILWRKTAPAENIEHVHETSSPASSTPATDGKRVYVYFGSYGLLCYDFEGTLQWEKPLPSPKAPYGTAASPVLVDGLVLQPIHKGALLALDQQTGETVWTFDDPLLACSYPVPLVHRTASQTEVILHASGGIVALDARDGSRLWWVSGLPIDPAPSPILADGLVYAIAYYPGGAVDDGVKLPSFNDLLKEYDKNKDENISQDELPKTSRVLLSRGGVEGEGDVTLEMLFNIFNKIDMNKDTLSKFEWGILIGFMAKAWDAENAILAIRPGGRGDVSETNIVWKEQRSLPEIPSALHYRGNLYAVKNGGVVTCLDAKTGELHYRDRLQTLGLNFASPVAGDGKIYVAALSGQVVVFAAGDKFNILAKNNLGEPIAATPAILEGKIYIRGRKHLFAFGQ